MVKYPNKPGIEIGQTVFMIYASMKYANLQVIYAYFCLGCPNVGPGTMRLDFIVIHCRQFYRQTKIKTGNTLGRINI